MKIQEELEKVFGPNRLRVNESMATHTSFKAGGPAEYYLDVEQLQDLITAVSIARSCGESVSILGTGTFAGVLENGIKGLVIKNNCRKFEMLTMRGKVVNQQIDVDMAYIMAESGVIMNQLVRYTIDASLQGLEYQLGLPGTIGGAVYANAYFPKKSFFIGDVVSKVKILTPSGEIKEVDREYCAFSSGKSSFQSSRDIILSVIFELSPGNKKILWERGTDAVTYRNDSQPNNMINGCMYRNFFLSDQMVISDNELRAYFSKAGLLGKKIGNVMISPDNPRYILNMGGGTIDEVMQLMSQVKEILLQTCNVSMDFSLSTLGIED